MVYNNSTLLDVPWETILKLFREKLGARSFPTLGQYAQELLEFLRGNTKLFPLEAQRRHFLILVRQLFAGIEKSFRASLVRRAGIADDAVSFDQGELLAEIVDAKLKHWRALRDVSAERFGTADAGGEMVGQASDRINKAVFEAFPSAEADLVSKLYELAKLVVNKEEIAEHSLSGIVIAGFGDEEHFPSMEQIEIGGIYLDKPKFNRVEVCKISSDTAAYIKPFAESDVVRGFLDGISPPLEAALTGAVYEVITELSKSIIDDMPGVDAAAKAAYKRRMEPAIEDAIVETVAGLKKFRNRKHLEPITQSLEFLPKDELANAASSLVKLSSFQPRISSAEDETIGGPIDVAVISKGDGFVWIDRKHYFRAELNEHFFRNRRVSADGQTWGKDDDATREGSSGAD